MAGVRVRRNGAPPKTTARRPPTPARDSTEPETGGAARVLRVIGPIIANTTLLTALLFYFGFLYTQVFFAHFRVHYTVLGQSLEEILARGADGLFVPLAVLGAAALAGICAVRYLKLRLRARTWLAVMRICTPLAAVAGAVLVVAAVIVTLDAEPFRDLAGLPGLGFAVGMLLLLFAWRRLISPYSESGALAGTAVAEWGITFLLVSIGLFWSVSDYSAQVGARRAFEVEQRITAMPQVLLYSAGSLNLSAPDVQERECRQPDSTYRYRYDGLKLLLQSGDQYVLLPATWSAASGVAVLLPRTDSLRLEFLPADATTPDC